MPEQHERLLSRLWFWRALAITYGVVLAFALWMLSQTGAC